MDKKFEGLSEEQKAVAEHMIKVRMEEENKRLEKKIVRIVSPFIAVFVAGATLLGLVLLIAKLLKALLTVLGFI